MIELYFTLKVIGQILGLACFVFIILLGILSNFRK